MDQSDEDRYQGEIRGALKSAGRALTIQLLALHDKYGIDRYGVIDWSVDAMPVRDEPLSGSISLGSLQAFTSGDGKALARPLIREILSGHAFHEHCDHCCPHSTTK